MIENVLTRLLFKYAGAEAGLFHQMATFVDGDQYGIKIVGELYGRPAGACDFTGAHYRHNHPEPIEFVDFSDSPPEYYEADPDHPWRVQIRAELVELFDLILEKPMTELLFTCDPTGAEIEKELKHLRRFDP